MVQLSFSHFGTQSPETGTTFDPRNRPSKIKVLTVWSVDYLLVTRALYLERHFTAIVFGQPQTFPRQISQNLCELNLSAWLDVTKGETKLI